MIEFMYFIGRGRPKRNANVTDESDSHDDTKDSSATEGEEAPKNAETDGKSNEVPMENNTHENKEEPANNNAAEAAKV